MRAVKLAKENNQRIRFLTDDEEKRLLRECRVNLKPLVVAAFHTGFRLSELLSLTWEDVDFVRRSVAVKAGYAKNGESRSIPMNQSLIDTLNGIKMLSGAVFRTRLGKAYRSPRTTFELAVTRAEIEDFTFHDLRHTFASRLVMAGVDLPTVRELMRHKEISMTLRYAHLSDDHKQRAVEILSTPFSTPPTEKH